MANLLTRMRPTVQCLLTNLSAYLHLTSTFDSGLYFLAVALLLYVYVTWLAISLMTLFRTCMLHAVLQFLTLIVAAEIASRNVLAWHFLLFLFAITSHSHIDIAWQTTPWMAQ
jgi:hypothetical protein